MQTAIKKILEQGLGNRILRANQLSRVLGGSNAKRYGLVNRAVKSGELLRLQRGVYVLADRYRSSRSHPFSLAQALVPGSYISFETALSFHGWIPEKVHLTASVVPGRKSRYYEDERFGSYRFHSLAIESGFFLELVQRHSIDEQTMLVASPCRALMDLVCLRKISWQGLGWLVDSLRLDPDCLQGIIRRDIKKLKHVYKHKQMQLFLAFLSQELNID